MNPNTAANWSLDTYTDDTWTDLVDEPAIIANLSIANTTEATINVSVRVSDGSGNKLAVIVPVNAIEGGDAFRVDLRAMAITGSQTLQVQASAAGVDFFASGAVEGA